MKHMTPEQWSMHINAINDWHEDAFQEEIIWRRSITTLSKHGEDNNLRYEDIPLKVLVYYNVFRSWPIGQDTDTGNIDKQSCMLYINKKWMSDNGYLNSIGQWVFDSNNDRFIVNGITHIPSGDSDLSQAYDNPLLIFLILKRETINTGTIRFPK